MLVNSDIKIGTASYKASKVIFKFDFERPLENVYFKYLSRDNLLVENNTYFFRDIIMYRNVQYVGTGKSWVAYQSGLKRFF